MSLEIFTSHVSQHPCWICQEASFLTTMTKSKEGSAQSSERHGSLSRTVALFALVVCVAVICTEVYVSGRLLSNTHTRLLRAQGDSEGLEEIMTMPAAAAAAAAAPTINSDPMGHIDPQVRIKHFKDTALSFKPVTDKIGYSERDHHRYHNMYGQFLLPFAAHTPTMKFLEIGLGCNMNYGAGASVKIWKTLFPQAELWEAEYDKICAEKARVKGQLDGIHVLVGDQGDLKTLDSWIETSGGNFDIIIDDGGHHNCQIKNTFEKMWPQLNPGGYYFIEDLHVGLARMNRPSNQCTNIPFHEYLAEWQKQLIYQTFPGFRGKYKLPDDLMFVHCQAEACVLHKRKDHVNLPYAEEPGAVIDQFRR